MRDIVIYLYNMLLVYKFVFWDYLWNYGSDYKLVCTASKLSHEEEIEVHLVSIKDSLQTRILVKYTNKKTSKWTYM
jgi:hypothetical protein